MKHVNEANIAISGHKSSRIKSVCFDLDVTLYDFQKVIPDTIGGVPTDSILVIEPVDVEFHQQNRLRAIAGLTFYIGPIYLHYDYNIVTYNTHNMMFGIKIR